MIGSKKVVLSLNSMDTISTLKAQIADMENCSVKEIQVSCTDDCKFHLRYIDEGVTKLHSFYDEHKIADCYTIVSEKYFYPWTWKEPWYKEGFMDHVT